LALSITASIITFAIAASLVWFFVHGRDGEYKRLVEAEAGETSRDYVWRVTRLLDTYRVVARRPWAWFMSKDNIVNEIRVLISKTPDFSGRFQAVGMNNTGTKLITLTEYDKLGDRVDTELMDLQSPSMQQMTQAVRPLQVESRVGFMTIGVFERLVYVRNRVLQPQGEKGSIHLSKSFSTIRSPAVELGAGGLRIREVTPPSDEDKQGQMRLTEYAIHKTIRKRLYLSPHYEFSEVLIDGYMPTISSVSPLYGNVRDGNVLISTFDKKFKTERSVQELARETTSPLSIAFSQDGKSTVIRSESKIFVLTVGGQDVFEFDVPSDASRYVLSRSPATRPLLAAVQAQGTWYFGWLEPNGVRVIKAEIENGRGRILSSELLLSGLEEAGSVLVFSTDGRWMTLIQEDLQGLMNVRSWSLGSERLARLSEKELVAEACAIVKPGVCNGGAQRQGEKQTVGVFDWIAKTVWVPIINELFKDPLTGLPSATPP
jgi:hypothetical protein